METSLLAPWSLAALLHRKHSALPKEIRNRLLIKDTIAAWKACRETFKLPYQLSKYMPLWGHPEFRQGLEGKQFQMWRDRSILTVSGSSPAHTGKEIPLFSGIASSISVTLISVLILLSSS